jgi:uncharacterized protein (TIGR02147 family)
VSVLLSKTGGVFWWNTEFALFRGESLQNSTITPYSILVRDESILLVRYSDYRIYLRDRIDQWKQVNPNVSYRFLSRQAGFRSPNFLLLILQKKRNLSIDGALKVSKLLGHNSFESDFFCSLVQFNQEKSSALKSKIAETLFRHRIQLGGEELAKVPGGFHSKWYFPFLRELISLQDFKDDDQWLRQRTRGTLQPQEVREAFGNLIRMGLIEKIPESSKLRQVNSVVSTGNEVSNALVYGYHAEMIRRAGEALWNVSSPEREISSVTLSISRKKFSELKDRIQKFRREVLEWIQTDQEPEEVYQLNLQFFPLTGKPCAEGENL